MKGTQSEKLSWNNTLSQLNIVINDTDLCEDAGLCYWGATNNQQWLNKLDEIEY